MENVVETGFEQDDSLLFDSKDRAEKHLLRVPGKLSSEFIRMAIISHFTERMGFNETRVRINEKKNEMLTMRVNSMIKMGVYSSPASIVNREGN
jgi:hypothetical protein